MGFDNNIVQIAAVVAFFGLTFILKSIGAVIQFRRMRYFASRRAPRGLNRLRGD